MVQRIVHLTHPGGRGSGYVIAPGLVLTSAHVVPDGPGAEVKVFSLADLRTHTGTVAWRGTPDGRDDAALVEVPSARLVETPIRWGRIVTNVPGTGCQAWGFPDVAQRGGQAIETAQPAGTINPGNRYLGDRYTMDITAHPPRWEGRGSPWAGLSGAALVCDDLVVGVVATDPAHSAHASIEAVPAYVLHRDPGFRDVLDRHSALGPLEAVELRDAHLHERPTRSPAGLLRARRRVVDFHGRSELMADLAAWCLDGEDFAARLIHGPGGQGKTRLAHELADRLSDPAAARRWATLWLDRDAPAEALDMVAKVTVPLLVVVDYAETRTAQLIALLNACDRRDATTPVRVLMLARTAGDWWENLPSGSDACGELLDTATATYLPPLVAAPEDRADEYRLALTHLAAALPTVRGRESVDWAAAAARMSAPDLRSDEWRSALAVHMRALADLLDVTDPAVAVAGAAAAGGRRPVEDRLLEHEIRYWETTARGHDLSRERLPDSLRDLLAIAFALTPADPGRAALLVGAAPGLRDRGEAERRQAVRWITSLYPAEENRIWGQLQPDRLLERFLGLRLKKTPDLFAPYLDGIARDDAERLLTLYARAAAQPAFDSALDAQLARLCADHARELGPAAIEVATQVEAPQPLIDGLNAVSGDPDAPVRVLEGLHNSLPPSSQRLAEYAAELSTRLVDRHRALAERRPDLHLPDLAASLNNRAVELGDLGRREEALEAASEAVGVYATLVEQRPDLHLPGFAVALGTLSSRLGDLGRHEEALKVSADAVRVRRALVGRRPDLHLPDLAMSLNNQADHLSTLGRHEEALEAVSEAVRVRRALADRHPDTYLSDLSHSLNARSVLLARLRRAEPALEDATESVRIHRALAEQRPDAHLPDLAQFLNNRANRLSSLGRREEALESVTESVSMYRALAEQRPDAHLPGLAMSLDGLSNHLRDLERHEPALEAVSEAVYIRRTLADRYPEAYLHDFAMSLNNLADRLNNLGRTDGALEFGTESVRIHRILAEQRPDAHLPGLATALSNQTLFLILLRRYEQAWPTITEAIDIRRRLADLRPEVHRKDLELSLRILAWLEEEDP
ncbi:tetratricopeptide repeat protein [Nocardiopsis protaetiae]|uniref:tetratricopeptide repeat protein n=1 Tax=Nocardiopsis protaetiae TaxID=3382270 RepID=UPI00387B8374